jgi:anti-sigma B factor antagonist
MITFPEPTKIGSHTVVEVAGDVDVSCASALRDNLLALVNRGVPSLVVDLRPVTFIDSTGVGSLLRIFHRQTLLGGATHFVADHSPVLRVFEVMQLTRRLHLVPSLAAVDGCCPQVSGARVIKLPIPSSL